MTDSNTLRIIFFLLLNFGALAIGGLYTAPAVTGEWYGQLNKAPWTPPGWVFGAAWTFIMLCLAVYMGFLLNEPHIKTKALVVYGVQWVLNVLWNPLFFKCHFVGWALLVIVLLTIVVTALFFLFLTPAGFKSILLVPYMVWLVIATSLNAYIVLKN
jgi:tryptophan-rich sensory protein